jgi:hypothetical protein
MTVPGPDRATRRRRAGAVGMYNQVFVRLILAATVTFAVIFILAFLYLVPLGQRSARAVVPVMNGYAQAVEAGDRFTARRLLSMDALRTGRAETLLALADQPDLFAGYQGVSIDSFQLLGPSPVTGEDMASVRATVRFGAGHTGTLHAVLVLEGDTWRINDLRYVPSGAAR